MRRAINAVLFLLLAFAVVASAQTADGEEVGRLINDGASAYRAGRYVEAQKLFEKALELDPEGRRHAHSKHLTLFIARALHQQYRPHDNAPENRAKAEAAVAAYKRVLADERFHEKHHEDAFTAVAYLYRLLGEKEKEDRWILTRATDPSAPNGKRSDAYTVLASKQWDCGYQITERKENKQTIDQGDRGIVVRYKKPGAQRDFDVAQGCVREGLGLIEQALTLNPDSVNAWSYKTNLLRERAKLAQMEGDAAAQAEYGRLADEAQARHTKLQEGAAEKREEVPKAGARVGPVGPRAESGATSPYPAPTPPAATQEGGTPRRRVTVSAGVLNGKAVSKPAPSYPKEAKEAGVSGLVTVQVTIDEEGAVAVAEAVGGHTLLHAAAVEAVRRWRFSPTRLSGQPVKVTGVVILNFVLP
ncbi:MAG TPA: TonB family protein [Pyrinomonadaceae bacterium]